MDAKLVVKELPVTPVLDPSLVQVTAPPIPPVGVAVKVPLLFSKRLAGPEQVTLGKATISTWQVLACPVPEVTVMVLNPVLAY